MIQSKEDRDRYIRADLKRANIGGWSWAVGVRYPLLRYQRLLRRTEFVVNCRKGRFWKPYVLFCLFRLRRAGMKLGFTIHPNNFGPGLSIAHWGTIVVNPKCRIGANCRIHPGTSLGETDGGAPVLGDDCYIEPGARLFGLITLGDRVSIGANAVVHKSFGSDLVLVGVPARAISKHSVADEE